jgi:hypothetical protein
MNGHTETSPLIQHDTQHPKVGTHKCRHCKRLFVPAKAYFVCCSWECQQAYKEAEAVIEQLDHQTDYQHPF